MRAPVRFASLPAWLEWQERLHPRAIEPGLERLQRVLLRTGWTPPSVPVVTVGGTNGKGSCVAFLETILRAGGRRIATFTSPHLIDYRERIRVDGREVTATTLIVAFERIADALGDDTLTFFEFNALAALLVFASARPDCIVLEVGMGGRLDAVNVVDADVAIVASLGLDHVEWLGPDLASIAREKAGVLRSGRVCVLGPLAPEARAAVEAEAARVGARLRAADEARVSRGPEGLTVETPLARYERLRTLPGAHQEANAVVALALLEEARAAGLPVDLAAAPAALASARWPGRLQWIEGDPPLLLDGAHNPAGARALAAYLEGRGPYVLVFGAMRDKDLRGMADALFPRAEAVVLTRPAAREAADPGALAALAPAGGRVEIEPDAARALAWARALARERGAFVVVAGSLYLVGEALGVAGGLAGDGLGERS
jgi:dihydrofolate synthase/folylpolyglutamate synthase